MKAADIIKHLEARKLTVNTPDHQSGIMLQLVRMDHAPATKGYPAGAVLIRGAVEPVDFDLRHHEHLNKYFAFIVFEDRDNLETLLMECANDIRKAYAQPLTVENAHENPA